MLGSFCRLKQATNNEVHYDDGRESFALNFILLRFDTSYCIMYSIFFHYNNIRRKEKPCQERAWITVILCFEICFISFFTLECFKIILIMPMVLHFIFMAYLFLEIGIHLMQFCVYLKVLYESSRSPLCSLHSIWLVIK